MNAKGWKGGSYGVRVGVANATQFFKSGWRTVEIEMDRKVHVFELSPGCWRDCPEIRGAEIGDWLKRHGLAPWPAFRPPDLLLEPLGDNRFRLLEAPPPVLGASSKR